MQKFVPGMVIFSMLILIAVGCGGDKKTETPATETPATNSSETASPEMQQSAAVVREFITAILKGYDDQAFSLLSQKAQNEYKRLGREFSIPANDQTEFKIDGVAQIPESNNELFGVAVTMTEAEGNDLRVTQWSWGVRNENGKFRIIGFVLNDSGMTMELDFEDLVGSDAKMQKLYEQQMQPQETIATAPQEYSAMQQPSSDMILPLTPPIQTLPQQQPPQQTPGQAFPQFQQPAAY